MVGSEPSLRHNPLTTNQEMVDSEPSLRTSDGNQYQQADVESGAGDASMGKRYPSRRRERPDFYQAGC